MKYYFRTFSVFRISVGDLECSDFCRSFISERNQALWILKDGSSSYVYRKDSIQVDLSANEVDKLCQKTKWDF